MKKRRAILIIAAICVCAVVVGLSVYGEPLNTFLRIGQARTAAEAAGDEALAFYKETPITRAMIKYQQSVDAEREESLRFNESEREIVDRLLAGLIMLDEAKAQGLEATDSEIEDYVNTLKENYEKSPQAAQIVDDYCKGAGITIDDYWADLQSQAYATISRQKLKDYVTQAYCKEVGYTGDTHTAEYVELATKAIDAYRQELLKTYAADIRYEKVS